MRKRQLNQPAALANRRPAAHVLDAVSVVQPRAPTGSSKRGETAAHVQAALLQRREDPANPRATAPTPRSGTARHVQAMMGSVPNRSSSIGQAGANHLGLRKSEVPIVRELPVAQGKLAAGKAHSPSAPPSRTSGAVQFAGGAAGGVAPAAPAAIWMGFGQAGGIVVAGVNVYWNHHVSTSPAGLFNPHTTTQIRRGTVASPILGSFHTWQNPGPGGGTVYVTTDGGLPGALTQAQMQWAWDAHETYTENRFGVGNCPRPAAWPAAYP